MWFMVICTVPLEPPVSEMVPERVSAVEQDRVAVTVWLLPAASEPEEALKVIQLAVVVRENDPDASPVFVILSSWVTSASPNVCEVLNEV